MKELRLNIILIAIITALYTMVGLMSFKMYDMLTELKYMKISLDNQESYDSSLKDLSIGRDVLRTEMTSDYALSDYVTYGAIGTETMFDDRIYIFLGVSDVDADYAKQFINLIPEKIAKKLYRDGYRFMFYNHEIGSEYENTVISGQVNVDEKVICFDCRKKALDTGVILHEVGHVVFKEYGLDHKIYGNNITDTEHPELLGYYDPFADGSSYIYSNIEELCANLFADYCIYPDVFKAQAPEIYSYYEEICK